MPNPEIIIITGKTGGGKTEFLQEMINFLNLFEKPVQGFISKGILNEKGMKDYILNDILTGHEYPLATRLFRPEYIDLRNFFFNPESIRAGNAIIRQALSDNAGILIMDEIGPFEIAEKVWYDALQEILLSYNGILILTVRMHMLDKVTAKFGIYKALVENIEERTPRKTAEIVLDLFRQKYKA